MTNKLRILIIGHLPPPPEGTAKINDIIIGSAYLKDRFRIELLSLMKRKTAQNRGKLGIINILHNLFNYLAYFAKLFTFNPDILYMPLAQNRMGYIRDSVFIITGNYFGKK